MNRLASAAIIWNLEERDVEELARMPVLRQGRRIGIRREQHTSPGDSLAHIDPSFFSTARHSGLMRRM